MNRLYLAAAVLALGAGIAFAQFSGPGFGVSGFGNAVPSSPPLTSIMITEDDNRMLTENDNIMVVE